MMNTVILSSYRFLSLLNMGTRPTMVNTYLSINACVGLSCAPPPTPSPTHKCTNIDTQRKLRVQVFKMMKVGWGWGGHVYSRNSI